MKTLTLAAVVISASLFPAHAFPAQESGQTSPSQAEQPAVNIQQFDKQMAQAQESLKKMQEQMSQIQKTNDPKERQRLLQQHQAMMQSGMDVMGQMWGNGMMGCCAGEMMGHQMMNSGMMGWDRMREHYSNLTPEQMKERQYMMDQYMGMQQMMMDQMMQHQHHMGMQPR